MASYSKAQRFSAALYKVGINRCVDVPEGVGSAFGQRRCVPVVATVGGHSVRTNLVPRGGGRYRLFLNGKVREAAGVDADDRVSLTLRLDRKSREIPIPKDVAKALSSIKDGRAAFEKMTLCQRREMLRCVLKAKKPATRERRIKKIKAFFQEAVQKKQKGSGS